MPKLNVLISGSTGYIGIELVKILSKHKYVKIKFLCGNTSVGKKITYYDKSLNSINLPRITKFKKKYLKNIDVIFTALPNGEAQKISKYLSNQNILIDIAADFRLNTAKSYLKWYEQIHFAPMNINKSIYSLPEFSESKLKNYNIISCPGCYPTSILLPLIPLVRKRIINLKNIIIDSKSGYSGAGRSVHKKYKNLNLYESIKAYGVGFHRHNSEIEQEIKKITKKDNFNITFTPHLTPMFRGILSTIYIETKRGYKLSDINKEFEKTFANKKFVHIKKPNSLISTNDVINSNFCYISVCKTKFKNKFIILSAIDNLIKGGSGQAVQNMNIRFNLPQSTGLL